MAISTISLGPLQTSRFILGSNPFSAFSHLGLHKDQEMRHYFTAAHIMEVFRQAEGLGVTTLIARADHHIMRLLCEYWDAGGTLQWFAQTCPELGNFARGIQNAVAGGAKACHLHGGVMDYLLATGQLDEVSAAIVQIKEAGLLAGIAGHNSGVFRWAEEHLEVDYYMCSYYNPIPRDKGGEHIAGTEERFLAEDRDAMAACIATLGKPVIHYKVMAAGRNDPEEAFGYVARALRPRDMVCVGVFPKDHPAMLQEDVRLLEKYSNVSTTRPI